MSWSWDQPSSLLSTLTGVDIIITVERAWTPFLDKADCSLEWDVMIAALQILYNAWRFDFVALHFHETAFVYSKRWDIHLGGWGRTHFVEEILILDEFAKLYLSAARCSQPLVTP